MKTSGEQKLQAALRAGAKRDYPRAVAVLEQLISETDAPPEAYLLLGRSFHSLKDYSRALAAFKDYVRLSPRTAQGYFFAGRTYLVLGMPQRAVPLLQKALTIRKTDPQIMAMLGLAFLKTRRAAEAVEVLEAAVNKAPQNARIYRAYLNALFIRGIRLCRNGDFDLGIQMLNFLLDNGMDNPLLRLELGMACRDTGMLPEALEHFTAAIQFSPGDPVIYWYRASVYMALGKNEDALNEIDFIRSQWGNLPDLPWNSELIDQFMIQACMESRQWRRAIESCRNWIRNRGGSPQIHVMYAEALRNLRDYRSAKNHLDRGLEYDPSALELWYEYMLVAWESGDQKSLRKALNNIRNLGGDPAIVNKYTVLYESRSNGNDEEMIPRIQDAIRTYGPEPDLMYALGERYLKIGLIQEALGWFGKIQTIQVDHERAALGQIAGLEVLFNEGSKKALDSLKKAYGHYLGTWGGNRNIRREFSHFLIHICEFTEASRELEKLLILEPDNPSLRRVLAYTYRKSDRYREAAVLLKGLLKEKPKDKELLLEYAGCLERAGSVHFASAVLEKALPLFKGTTDVYLALGMLYYREKKTEKAFDMFREAAAKNTKDPRPYEWMAAISRKNGDNQGATQYEFEAEKRKKSSKH